MARRLVSRREESPEKDRESRPRAIHRTPDKGGDDLSSGQSPDRTPKISDNRETSKPSSKANTSLYMKPGVPLIDFQPEEPDWSPGPASVRPIQVKVSDLDGQQSIFSVNPSRRVSTLLSHIPNYSPQRMRLSYNYCELDTDLTFAFQGVVNGSEICIELILTLHCNTDNGAVTLTELGSASISKLKMDAVVAARLDSKESYELRLHSAVLGDDFTVASIHLDHSSPLQLRQVNIPKPKPSPSQALVHSLFSSAVPGSNIINSNIPVAQLQRQGFRRHILDPIMYYKMTLLYGAAEDVRTGNNLITVKVEVVSWGSLPFTIDPRQTIREMKQQLARTIKIPESNQSIIFNGQPLQDSSTLQSCGLADGYSVILTCTGDSTYLFLPLEFFDSTGDRDFTIYTTPPDLGMRGGEHYYPPCGWRRYGLKVTGKFENDIWLGMSNGRE